MGLADLETTLSDHERAVRDTARRFAREALRPAGAALDRLPDPAAVIAADSIMWKVFDQYRDLQLDVLDGATCGVSPLEHARLRFLIAEELGWGDAGLPSASACRASTRCSLSCRGGRR
jgi:alkylation response protein AidB-like acyl-CoA dehydrogenase